MTYFVCHLQEVNIEFEAYSISDNDYDGIKKGAPDTLVLTLDPNIRRRPSLLSPFSISLPITSVCGSKYVICFPGSLRNVLF